MSDDNSSSYDISEIAAQADFLVQTPRKGDMRIDAVTATTSSEMFSPRGRNHNEVSLLDIATLGYGRKDLSKRHVEDGTRRIAAGYMEVFTGAKSFGRTFAELYDDRLVCLRNQISRQCIFAIDFRADWRLFVAGAKSFVLQCSLWEETGDDTFLFVAFNPSWREFWLQELKRTSLRSARLNIPVFDVNEASALEKKVYVNRRRRKTSAARRGTRLTKMPSDAPIMRSVSSRSFIARKTVI